jgi:nitroreductase
MTVAAALHWRYATKRMNGQEIPQEQLGRILEAVRLAPSSFGLQPYTVLVIGDQALRERIKPVAAGQSQITECSHLLVFAAWDPVREEHVDQLIRLTAEERGISSAELEGYKNTIKDAVRRLSPAERHHWAAKQAYLALGTALVAAAAERIDASPMEGFDPASLDELLGLKERGLRSVVLLALGYRDNTTDWLAPLKKVRWPREKLFVHLTEQDVLRAVEPAVAKRSLAFK